MTEIQCGHNQVRVSNSNHVSDKNVFLIDPTVEIYVEFIFTTVNTKTVAKESHVLLYLCASKY